MGTLTQSACFFSVPSHGALGGLAQQHVFVGVDEVLGQACFAQGSGFLGDNDGEFPPQHSCAQRFQGGGKLTDQRGGMCHQPVCGTGRQA